MISSLWQTIAIYRYFEFEDVWDGKVDDIYENFDGCYEVVKKSGFLKEFEKNLCCVESDCQLSYKKLQALYKRKYDLNDELQGNEKFVRLYNMHFRYR